MRSYYDTLADLNDLVLRDCEPQILFEEACRLITRLSPELSAAVISHDLISGDYLLAAWSSNLEEQDGWKNLSDLRFCADNAIPEGQGLVGHVLRTGRSVLWDERAILESGLPAPQLLHRAGSRAQLGVPIAVGDDIAGVLILSACAGDYFTPKMRHLAERIAANISHGVRSHRQRLALEHEAFIDALTGLPNRTLLMDRLKTAIARAARDGTCIVLALVDLDGLKEINDQFGHSVGDAVIRTIAQRLSGRVREADTVARIAGDEFAGVFLLGHRADGLDLPAQRLLQAISQPVEVDGVCFEVTAGLGLARYPDDAVNAQELMRRADLALHQAKSRGRNCWSLFEAEAEAELVRRRRTRERFLQGLTEGEVVFYYQPKVDMRSGTVFGAEALVRWRDREKGIRSPGEWLHVIEAEASLSAALGRHALTSVVEQLAEWHEMGLKLFVSVNVSACHLQMPGFLEDVRHALSGKLHLAPYLCLEITETTLVQDAERLSETLTTCRELGLRVALDDFGTGYASLAYLQRLPADVVKVDVDFVLNMPREMRAFSIVAGTLQMCQMLGIKVVAEGVETEEHGIRLLQLGCTSAQGFAISPALPAGDFKQWMETWQAPVSWTKERQVATATIPHRLLAGLVYHRERGQIIFADRQKAMRTTGGGQARCPLHAGQELSGLSDSLRMVHRELHELEDTALECFKTGSSCDASNRDALRNGLITLERMINDEL